MYVGQQPVVGRYILLDQISGGFNGTASGFTMTAGGQGVIPGLAQNVLLSLGGVIQQPGADYLVSGSGLTFTTPPVSGTTFFATVLGDAQAVGTPSDGTVIPASIASSGTFVFPNVTVTGVTTIASGTASAPSLSISGDANTGLYSPAADQLAISTNGTGRLFVDAIGNVSIGTASGTNSAGYSTLTLNGSTGGQIAFWTGGSARQFIYSTSTDLTLFNNNGPTVFFNGGSERMRLDSSGRLGLGTSSPQGLLHVEGVTGNAPVRIVGSSTNSSALALYNNAATTNRFVIGQGFSTGSDNVAFIQNDANAAMVFGTNATERLRITAGGAVGIGTATPQDPLHVIGQIRAGYSGVTKFVNLFPGDAVNSPAIGFSSADSLRFVGAAEYMRLDSSGRLGVGTSSPVAPITVVASSNNTDIAVFNGSTGTSRGLKLSTGTNFNSDALVIYDAQEATYGAHLFRTRGTNALFIDQSQRVGIGTTAADQSLSVQGLISTKAPDGSTRGLVGSPSWDTSYFAVQNGTLAQSAANAALHQNTVGVTTLNSASGYPIVFTVGQVERARIDSSGRLLVGTSTAATVGNAQVARVAIKGYPGSATGQAILSLQSDRAVNNITAGNRLGEIGFNGGDGSPFAEICGEADGTAGSGDYPGRLVFSTTADGASSPTERCRIANNGVYTIYSSTSALFIGSAGAAGTSEVILNGYYGATGTTNLGTLSFRVYTNGNTQNTNNSYAGISDIKLKENIVDASPQWDDIKALQVRKYNFKEGQTHTQIGLIAQEVELVSPGLVFETPDRDAEGNDLGTVTKSVNYSVLYMKAVKALQEAMERIEQLEFEMAAVKSQLS